MASLVNRCDRPLIESLFRITIIRLKILYPVKSVFAFVRLSVRFYMFVDVRVSSGLSVWVLVQYLCLWTSAELGPSRSNVGPSIDNLYRVAT